ncbi:MAG: hypothetical protein ACFCVE_03420 [Phycisphaerae bacterium]
MPRGKSAAKMSIRELESELQNRRNGLEKMLSRRQKLLSELSDLEEEIKDLGGDLTAAPAGRLPRRKGGGKRPRNEQSLADTIYGVMKAKGKPMSVGDVVSAVEATGYKSGSANFRGIVNQTLIKDDRFKASSRGMYEAVK